MDSPIHYKPKYEAEVISIPFGGRGDYRCIVLRGLTAREIVEQFNAVKLQEEAMGYEAHLPSEIFDIALQEQHAPR